MTDTQAAVIQAVREILQADFAARDEKIGAQINQNGAEAVNNMKALDQKMEQCTKELRAQTEATNAINRNLEALSQEIRNLAARSAHQQPMEQAPGQNVFNQEPVVNPPPPPQPRLDQIWLTEMEAMF